MIVPVGRSSLVSCDATSCGTQTESSERVYIMGLNISPLQQKPFSILYTETGCVQTVVEDKVCFSFNYRKIKGLLGLVSIYNLATKSIDNSEL